MLGEDIAFETGPSSGSEGSSTFTNVISGCFVFVNGGDAGDGRPDMNHHPRFNIVESSLAAGVKTEVQIVLDVLVMVSPETADRKGGHLD